jgi:hypothetical protein
MQLEVVKDLDRRELLRNEVVTEYQKRIMSNFLKAIEDEYKPEYKLENTMSEFSVFISYAHKDNESEDKSKRWLDRLLENLQPLILQDQVSIWSDEKIEMGGDWHACIQASLQQAKAAVLLVSPAFLASKYIRNSELPVLFKKAKDNGLIIIPIILRPCLFNETRFKFPHPFEGSAELSLSTLQSANPPNEPLNGLTEYQQDQILLSVAQQLLKIVQEN